MSEHSKPYRGRFAPSPTGPLHFGSLVAAVGSYLQARSQNGSWYLRIDDVDTPRTVAGAADDILRALAAFGLYWDGEPVYQSTRADAYAEALDRLVRDGLVYPCSCSRREVAAAGGRGAGASVYPGTCRRGPGARRTAHATRVLTTAAPVAVDDRVQGRLTQVLERDVGDFVVRRADGLFAYHLAVVVDDADLGITEIVRGADLLDSTPRQVYLQQRLGLPTPAYGHLPVAVDARGDKLSKQTGAAPIDPADPLPVLMQAFAFLGLAPEPALGDADLDAAWEWAMGQWGLEKVPRMPTLAVPGA